MTASVWRSVVFACASNTKGYLHRVTTPSWPWGYRGINKWFIPRPKHRQCYNMKLTSTVHSPLGTSASESMWRSHFWCLSTRPTHGCRIYHTEWCVLLSHLPDTTGKWMSSTVLHGTVWYTVHKSTYLKKKCLTVCRISRNRRDVSRKQVKILCSSEGIPTLCIRSRYTTTSLYNSTSRWKTLGSNVAHQFPDANTTSNILWKQG